MFGELGGWLAGWVGLEKDNGSLLFVQGECLYNNCLVLISLL